MTAKSTRSEVDALALVPVQLGVVDFPRAFSQTAFTSFAFLDDQCQRPVYRRRTLPSFQITSCPMARSSVDVVDRMFLDCRLSWNGVSKHQWARTKSKNFCSRPNPDNLTIHLLNIVSQQRLAKTIQVKDKDSHSSQ